MTFLLVNLCVMVVAACTGPEPRSGASSHTLAPTHQSPSQPTNLRIQPVSAPALSRNAVPLPGSVYAQWADKAVRVINMPAGTYYLSGNLPLRLHRSDVIVNFAGSTLVVNPSDLVSGSYPIQVSSVSRKSPVYRSSGSNDNGTRVISRLKGVITATTTQLAMDPTELTDVAAGEQVIIHAGVSPSDPFEAQDYIVATVASVSAAGLIKFTAPLGRDIVDYGNAAGLAAFVDAGQANKVGPWGTFPDTSNFSKGFGTDHGLERFVGGLVHDVTFNDLTMVLDLAGPKADAIPNTMWDVSAIAVRNFTMNRTVIRNPCGSALHLWRSFNAVIDGFTVTGAGIAKIWNSSTFASPAVTLWGGDGLTFRRMSVSGTNMTAFSAEVGPRRIWVDGLDYNVQFTGARNYNTSDVVLGFFAAQGPVRLTNVSLNASTTGGAPHTYFSYSPIIADGFLSFPGASLTDTFDFGYQKQVSLQGTVSIGGVTYGPPVTEVREHTLAHGNPRIAVPTGIYTAATMQLVTRGDVSDIWDSFGNRYIPAAFSGAPVALKPDKWLQIEAGPASLKKYVEKDLEFVQPTSGTTNGLVKIAITYLPVSSGTSVTAGQR